MFRSFAEKVMAYAIKCGYVPKDESEEYIYGLDLIMSVIFSDISMLIIGIIMHMIPEVIIFILLYKCIRKYGGGFHCETAITCYICSCIMCVCVLLAMKYFPYNFIIYIAATIILLALLFIMSPIEAINKPLDDIEFKVFGRRARFVILAVLAIFAAVCALGLSDIVKAMTISIADVTLFAIMGKVKLLYYKKKNYQNEGDAV